MSYSCRLYINSGFNTVNIPDSPTLLDSAAIQHIDCPALQILQSRDLRYIDVKVASYESIKNVDYARVDTWFYFVDGVQMLTVDTARLTVYADYLTSAGGPGALHYLDGITSRVHVASDGYGEWTEEDPYLVPARPLGLVTVRHGAGTRNITVVKSTLDLVAMGDSSAVHDGVTYTDSNTGETVTVPKTQINSGETTYYLSGETQADPDTQLTGESKTKLYDASKTAVLEGMRVVNDLGLNGSITAQVSIPAGYAAATESVAQSGEIVSMKGVNAILPSNVPYEYDSNVKNKRLMYSEHTPFGIIATGGAKIEFTPSQIYESGATSPHIRIVGDPRTDGKPYFRFLSFHGNDTLEGFFTNAIEGMPWKQIPLVYEGKEGAAIAQFNYNQSVRKSAFETDMATADIARQYRKNAAIGGESYGEGIGQIFQSALSGLGIGGIFGAAGGAVGAGASMFTKMHEAAGDLNYQREQTLKKYYFDKKQELEKYMVESTVYSPTLQFPYSADLYRDLYNNSCITYRYEYSSFDLARLDKILTMYGYKVTKNVERTDFTNRRYFNYVESSITVGELPRWWADGIAAQISNGVRVWHVKPNNSRYTDNPIRT